MRRLDKRTTQLDAATLQLSHPNYHFTHPLHPLRTAELCPCTLQWYDNGGFPVQVEVFLGRSRHKDQSESGIRGQNSAMMDKMQACEPQNPSSSNWHTQ